MENELKIESYSNVTVSDIEILMIIQDHHVVIVVFISQIHAFHHCSHAIFMEIGR